MLLPHGGRMESLFSKNCFPRSAKCTAKNQPADPEQENSEEELNDSILDLNTNDVHHMPASATKCTSPSGISVPISLSPLQPATSSGGLCFLQPTIPPSRSAAFHTVSVSTSATSSVFFKTPAPGKFTFSQDPVLKEHWAPEHTNDGEPFTTKPETNPRPILTITVWITTVPGLFNGANIQKVLIHSN